MSAEAVLRVLIVDDEELARLRLRTLLQDCVAPAAQVVGECGSAAAALEALGRQRCDLVLLDIHMPGLDGLQLAQRLRGLPQAPAVVFVTAHAGHALAAFEVEAVDYLTKPVRRLRLQEALARAALRRGAAVPASPPAVPDGPVILVHERGERIRVPVDEVLYLKAEQKYVQLRTAARCHWLDESLAELEQRLGERFLRVHRNALVARGAIQALERQGGRPGEADGEAEAWVVRVAPLGERLAVSRRQLPAVREALEREGLG